MIHIDTQTILTVAEEHDDLDIVVDHNYSGRAMYGRTCLAVEYRRHIGDAFTFMFALAHKLARIAAEGEEPSIEDVEYEAGNLLEQTPRMDNLGNNGLVYWPSIAIND
ncbi:hypothetical protein [Nocardia phage P3.1]|nr:hypothetical protein [Nocardia phage P3.1]